MILSLIALQIVCSAPASASGSSARESPVALCQPGAQPKTAQPQPAPPKPAQPKTDSSKPGEAEKKPAEPPPGRLGKDGYRVSNALLETLQDGTQGSGMEVSDHHVTNGQTVLTPETLKKTRNMEPALRINTFKVPPDTVMFQIDVSRKSKLSLLGKGVASERMDTPIVLHSADGQAFNPVGYWYEDDAKVVVRYTLDKPIRSQQELEDEGVMVTRSRSDQHLYLLFTPSAGVDITRLSVGKSTLYTFDPPVKTVDAKQK